MYKFPEYKSGNRVLRNFFCGSAANEIAQVYYWLWINKFRDNWMACYSFLPVYLVTGTMAARAKDGAGAGVEVRVPLFSMKTRVPG